MYRKSFTPENLILFFFLVIYILSVGLDPILGDSLAFTVVATNGFDLATNATNHFLYMNFLAVLHKIVPFINSHHLFVAVSVICSTLTLFYLRKLLTLFDIDKRNINIAIVLFGFSFTFWRISVITEVYSFYILFVTIFLFHIFSFVKDNRKANLYWASVLFGVLFLIHIQTILLVPFYLFFLYQNLRNQPRAFIAGILIPSFIFTILLIPVFQAKHSFMAIFTDGAWGSSFFDLQFKIFVKSLGRNLLFLVYNFLFFLYFIYKGIKNIEHKKYFIIAVLPYIFFILKHDVSDSYVFHLVPYLLLVIIIGKGLSDFKVTKSKIAFLISIPVIYFFSFKIIAYSSYGKKMNDEIGFKGGTRYFFFPPLRGNPGLESFIRAYEQNQLKDKDVFTAQYEYAKEWVQNKKAN